MNKLEINPGRSTSAIGMVMGIMATVFGIFWTGMTLYLSRPWDQPIEPGIIFLVIFGVMFVILSIVITAFYARSTFSKKRPSILDISEQTGDEIRASGAMENRTNPDGEINFCPYCGKTVRKDFSYCQACGKKLIT